MVPLTMLRIPALRAFLLVVALLASAFATELTILGPEGSAVRPVIGFSGQDADGSHQVSEDGTTVALAGNAWRGIDLGSVVLTNDAVLSFEVLLEIEGEIQAVGLAPQNDWRDVTTYQFAGTQPLMEYVEPAEPGSWTRYQVSLADLDACHARYLVFVNDDDGAGTGAYRVRNLSLEGVLIGEPPLAPVQVTVAGVERLLPVAALGSQHAQGSINPYGEGEILAGGNTWGLIDLGTSLPRAGALLRFEALVEREGEIQGLGLSQSTHYLDLEMVQIAGSYTWHVWHEGRPAAVGWQAFEVPLDDLGFDPRYLAIVNDDDRQVSRGRVRYRNVSIGPSSIERRPPELTWAALPWPVFAQHPSTVAFEAVPGSAPLAAVALDLEPIDGSATRALPVWQAGEDRFASELTVAAGDYRLRARASGIDEAAAEATASIAVLASPELGPLTPATVNGWAEGQDLTLTLAINPGDALIDHFSVWYGDVEVVWGQGYDGNWSGTEIIDGLITFTWTPPGPGLHRFDVEVSADGFRWQDVFDIQIAGLEPDVIITSPAADSIYLPRLGIETVEVNDRWGDIWRWVSATVAAQMSDVPTEAGVIIGGAAVDFTAALTALEERTVRWYLEDEFLGSASASAAFSWRPLLPPALDETVAAIRATGTSTAAFTLRAEFDGPGGLVVDSRSLRLRHPPEVAIGLPPADQVEQHPGHIDPLIDERLFLVGSDPVIRITGDASLDGEPVSQLQLLLDGTTVALWRAAGSATAAPAIPYQNTPRVIDAAPGAAPAFDYEWDVLGAGYHVFTAIAMCADGRSQWTWTQVGATHFPVMTFEKDNLMVVRGEDQIEALGSLIIAGLDRPSRLVLEVPGLGQQEYEFADPTTWEDILVIPFAIPLVGWDDDNPAFGNNQVIRARLIVLDPLNLDTFGEYVVEEGFNLPPEVLIHPPANPYLADAVAGVTTVSSTYAVAAGSSAVTSIQFEVFLLGDEALVPVHSESLELIVPAGELFDGAFPWTPPVIGTYELRARVVDENDEQATSSCRYHVGIPPTAAPPTVSIVNPQHFDQVSKGATVAITLAVAHDDPTIGLDHDGVRLTAIRGTYPYTRDPVTGAVSTSVGYHDFVPLGAAETLGLSQTTGSGTRADGAAFVCQFAVPENLSGFTVYRLRAVARVLLPGGGYKEDVDEIEFVVNFDPEAFITWPTHGGRVQSGDLVTIRAAVWEKDPTDIITAVRFYADGTMLGEDTELPYEMEWRVPVRPLVDADGQPSASRLRIEATSSDGTVVERVIQVRHNTPPSIQIASPPDGLPFMPGDPVAIEVEASDADYLPGVSDLLRDRVDLVRFEVRWQERDDGGHLVERYDTWEVPHNRAAGTQFAPATQIRWDVPVSADPEHDVILTATVESVAVQGPAMGPAPRQASTTSVRLTPNLPADILLDAPLKDVAYSPGDGLPVRTVAFEPDFFDELSHVDIYHTAPGQPEALLASVTPEDEARSMVDYRTRIQDPVMGMHTVRMEAVSLANARNPWLIERGVSATATQAITAAVTCYVLPADIGLEIESPAPDMLVDGLTDLPVLFSLLSEEASVLAAVDEIRVFANTIQIGTAMALAGVPAAADADGYFRQFWQFTWSVGDCATFLENLPANADLTLQVEAVALTAGGPQQLASAKRALSALGRPEILLTAPGDGDAVASGSRLTVRARAAYVDPRYAPAGIELTATLLADGQPVGEPMPIISTTDPVDDLQWLWTVPDLVGDDGPRDVRIDAVARWELVAGAELEAERTAVDSLVLRGDRPPAVEFLWPRTDDAAGFLVRQEQSEEGHRTFLRVGEPVTVDLAVSELDAGQGVDEVRLMADDEVMGRWRDLALDASGSATVSMALTMAERWADNNEVRLVARVTSSFDRVRNTDVVTLPLRSEASLALIKPTAGSRTVGELVDIQVDVGDAGAFLGFNWAWDEGPATFVAGSTGTAPAPQDPGRHRLSIVGSWAEGPQAQVTVPIDLLPTGDGRIVCLSPAAGADVPVQAGLTILARPELRYPGDSVTAFSATLNGQLVAGLGPGDFSTVADISHYADDTELELAFTATWHDGVTATLTRTVRAVVEDSRPAWRFTPPPAVVVYSGDPQGDPLELRVTVPSRTGDTLERVEALVFRAGEEEPLWGPVTAPRDNRQSTITYPATWPVTAAGGYRIVMQAVWQFGGTMALEREIAVYAMPALDGSVELPEEPVVLGQQVPLAVGARLLADDHARGARLADVRVWIDGTQRSGSLAGLEGAAATWYDDTWPLAPGSNGGSPVLTIEADVVHHEAPDEILATAIETIDLFDPALAEPSILAPADGDDLPAGVPVAVVVADPAGRAGTMMLNIDGNTYAMAPGEAFLDGSHLVPTWTWAWTPSGHRTVTLTAVAENASGRTAAAATVALKGLRWLVPEAEAIVPDGGTVDLEVDVPVGSGTVAFFLDTDPDSPLDSLVDLGHAMVGDDGRARLDDVLIAGDHWRARLLARLTLADASSIDEPRSIHIDHPPRVTIIHGQTVGLGQDLPIGVAVGDPDDHEALFVDVEVTVNGEPLAGPSSLARGEWTWPASATGTAAITVNAISGERDRPASRRQGSAEATVEVIDYRLLPPLITVPRGLRTTDWIYREIQEDGRPRYDDRPPQIRLLAPIGHDGAGLSPERPFVVERLPDGRAPVHLLFECYDDDPLDGCAVTVTAESTDSSDDWSQAVYFNRRFVVQRGPAIVGIDANSRISLSGSHATAVDWPDRVTLRLRVESTRASNDMGAASERLVFLHMNSQDTTLSAGYLASGLNPQTGPTFWHELAPGWSVVGQPYLTVPSIDLPAGQEAWNQGYYAEGDRLRPYGHIPPEEVLVGQVAGLSWRFPPLGSYWSLSGQAVRLRAAVVLADDSGIHHRIEREVWTHPEQFTPSDRGATNKAEIALADNDAVVFERVAIDSDGQMVLEAVAEDPDEHDHIKAVVGYFYDGVALGGNVPVVIDTAPPWIMPVTPRRDGNPAQVALAAYSSDGLRMEYPGAHTGTVYSTLFVPKWPKPRLVIDHYGSRPWSQSHELYRSYRSLEEVSPADARAMPQVRIHFPRHGAYLPLDRPLTLHAEQIYPWIQDEIQGANLDPRPAALRLPFGNEGGSVHLGDDRLGVASSQTVELRYDPTLVQGQAEIDASGSWPVIRAGLGQAITVTGSQRDSIADTTRRDYLLANWSPLPSSTAARITAPHLGAIFDPATRAITATVAGCDPTVSWFLVCRAVAPVEGLPDATQVALVVAGDGSAAVELPLPANDNAWFKLELGTAGSATANDSVPFLVLPHLTVSTKVLWPPRALEPVKVAVTATYDRAIGNPAADGLGLQHGPFRRLLLFSGTESVEAGGHADRPWAVDAARLNLVGSYAVHLREGHESFTATTATRDKTWVPGDVTSVSRTFTWIPTAAGTAAVQARADGAYGLIAWSGEPVVVAPPRSENLAPQIDLIAGTGPATRAMVAPGTQLSWTVRVTDGDGDGIERVVLTDDQGGAVVAAEALTGVADSWSVSWTATGRGERLLRIVARDRAGAEGEMLVPLLVDHAPKLVIQEPVPGHRLLAGATVPVMVQASDEDGDALELDVAVAGASLSLDQSGRGSVAIPATAGDELVLTAGATAAGVRATTTAIYPVNHAPTATVSLASGPTARAGETIDLHIDMDDPDGDPLAVTRLLVADSDGHTTELVATRATDDRFIAAWPVSAAATAAVLAVVSEQVADGADASIAVTADYTIDAAPELSVQLPVRRSLPEATVDLIVVAADPEAEAIAELRLYAGGALADEALVAASASASAALSLRVPTHSDAWLPLRFEAETVSGHVGVLEVALPVDRAPALALTPADGAVVARDEPVTIAVAVDDPDPDDWIQAMDYRIETELGETVASGTRTSGPWRWSFTDGVEGLYELTVSATSSTGARVAASTHFALDRAARVTAVEVAPQIVMGRPTNLTVRAEDPDVGHDIGQVLVDIESDGAARRLGVAVAQDGAGMIPWLPEAAGTFNLSAYATADGVGASRQSEAYPFTVEVLPRPFMELVEPTAQTALKVGQTIPVRVRLHDPLAGESSRVQMSWTGTQRTMNAEGGGVYVAQWQPSVGGTLPVRFVYTVDGTEWADLDTAITVGSAPRVRIDHPAQGATYLVGSVPNIAITAQAGVGGQPLTGCLIELFDPQGMVAASTQVMAPYAGSHQWAWLGQGTGDWRVRAVVTAGSGEGAETMTSEHVVSVVDTFDADLTLPQSLTVPDDLPAMREGLGYASQATLHEGFDFGLVAGDPVRLTDRAWVLGQGGLSLGGRGLPIVVDLVYNSRNWHDGIHDPGLAAGWVMSYDRQLVETAWDVAGAPTEVRYVEPDGRDYRFTWDGSQWQRPPGLFASLTKSGGQWVMQARDGVRSYFDTANGELTRIEDRFGNRTDIAIIPDSVSQGFRKRISNNRTGQTIEVVYGVVTVDSAPALRIESIRDAAGNGQNTLSQRTVGIAYDAAGRIHTVTDRAGAVWAFAYDAQGRVNERTDPLGGTVSVEYGDPARPWAVTRQELSNGNAIDFTVDTSAVERLTVVHHDGVTGDAREEILVFVPPTAAVPAFSQVAAHHDTLLDGSARPSARFLFTYTADGVVTRSEDTVTGLVIEHTVVDGLVTASSRPGFGSRTFQHNGFGQITTETSWTGITTSYSYSSAGALETRTIGDLVESYTHNSAGQVLTHTHADGTITTYTYDGRGHPTSAHHPARGTVATTYDWLGRLTAKVSPRGATTHHQYSNTTGFPTQTIKPGPVTITYQHDALGNKTGTTVSGAGVTNTWSHQYALIGYDGGYRVINTDGPDGTYSYSYNGTGDLLQFTDVLGRTRIHQRHANGFESAMLGPDGTAIASFAYDTALRQISQTDAVGVATITTYDALGRAIATRIDGLPPHTRIYDDDSRLLEETDPDGVTTTYGYDGIGRQTTVTEASGVVRETIYEATTGRVHRRSSGGPVIEYGYDSAGRLLKQTLDPDGAALTTSYSHALDGLVTSETDADGRVTGRTYDLLGRLETVTTANDDPDSSTGLTVTTYAYDALDRLLSTAQDGQTLASFTYDAMGRRLSRTEPAGGNQPAVVEEWTYRSDGSVATYTGPGVSRTYTYDDYGRVIDIAYTGAEGNFSHSYTYRTNGQLATATDAQGRTTVLDYNQFNRLASRTYDGRSVNYGYTTAGRLQHTGAWNGLNAILAYQHGRVSSISAFGVGANVLYDGAGRVVSVGNASLRDLRSYDSAGRLLGWEHLGSNSYGSQTFNYTNTRIDEIERDNLAMNTAHTFAFTPAGRLAELATTGDVLPSSSLLSFDALGNRTRSVDAETVIDNRYSFASFRLDEVIANPADDTREGGVSIGTSPEVRVMPRYDNQGNVAQFLARIDANGDPDRTPWRTRQLKLSPYGANGGVRALRMSAQGRHLVFSSKDTLSPADNNEDWDVYGLDRATGAVMALSLNFQDGSRQTANGPSHTPAIAANARYVAMVSAADDLVDGGIPDGNQRLVHLFDLRSGKRRQIAVQGHHTILVQVPDGTNGTVPVTYHYNEEPLGGSLELALDESNHLPVLAYESVGYPSHVIESVGFNTTDIYTYPPYTATPRLSPDGRYLVVQRTNPDVDLHQMWNYYETQIDPAERHPQRFSGYGTLWPSAPLDPLITSWGVDFRFALRYDRHAPILPGNPEVGAGFNQISPSDTTPFWPLRINRPFSTTFDVALAINSDGRVLGYGSRYPAGSNDSSKVFLYPFGEGILDQADGGASPVLGPEANLTLDAPWAAISPRPGSNLAVVSTHQRSLLSTMGLEGQVNHDDEGLSDCYLVDLGTGSVVALVSRNPTGTTIGNQFHAIAPSMSETEDVNPNISVSFIWKTSHVATSLEEAGVTDHGLPAPATGMGLPAIFERDPEYTYDAANRLIKSVGWAVTEYEYDAFDLLVKETCTYGAGPHKVVIEQHYVWDGLGENQHLVGMERHVTLGNNPSIRSDLNFAWGPLGLVAQRQTTTGNALDDGTGDLFFFNNQDGTYRVANDQQGSPVCFVDTAGNLAMQRTFATSGVIDSQHRDLWAPIGYTGHLHGIADGLIYMRARHYSPEHGRFLQRDTYEGDPLHPASFNRYAYAEGDPLRNTDPSGRATVHLDGEGWPYANTGSGQVPPLGPLAAQGASMIDIIGPIAPNGVPQAGVGLLFMGNWLSTSKPREAHLMKDLNAKLGASVMTTWALVKLGQMSYPLAAADGMINFLWSQGVGSKIDSSIFSDGDYNPSLGANLLSTVEYSLMGWKEIVSNFQPYAAVLKVPEEGRDMVRRDTSQEGHGLKVDHERFSSFWTEAKDGKKGSIWGAIGLMGEIGPVKAVGGVARESWSRLRANSSSILYIWKLERLENVNRRARQARYKAKNSPPVPGGADGFPQPRSTMFVP